MTAIQIKICGLMTPDQARACADLGAQAIGLIFYPKSPRFVRPEAAREIVAALPPHVAAVGVFVNESARTIMDFQTRCGFTVAQLHGKESPDLVTQLKARGLKVIKALFVDGEPAPAKAPGYEADAFLVECAKGPLPGGNALSWDWAGARGLGLPKPLILAGGLDPGNVAQALEAARPAAVDVSSGVETAPGTKDLQKVAAFIRAVGAWDHGHGATTPIF